MSEPRPPRLPQDQRLRHPRTGWSVRRAAGQSLNLDPPGNGT